jgi:hypothetical protein
LQRPARLIRFRFFEDMIARLQELKWSDLLPRQRGDVQCDDIDTALAPINQIRAAAG